MTAPSPLCCSQDCPNPSPDGFVCRSCAGELRRNLRVIPEVMGDLLITYTRQDVGDRSPGGGGSDEPPLLFRPEAAEVGRDLHAVLTVWTAHIMGRLGLDLAELRATSRPDIRTVPIGPARPPVPGQRTVPAPWWREDSPGGRFPDNDSLELALWLERHTETVRTDERAGELVDEIADAVARARRATDRPGSRIYLGSCDCSIDAGRAIDLYARPDAARVTCRNCETVWDVDYRRSWLLERSADVLVTPEVATRALPSLLGYDLTPDLLRRLHAREGLERYPPARTDPHRRYRYRIGDIVDAVQARAATAERRREGKRAARVSLEGLPEDVAAMFAAARVAAAASNRTAQAVQRA
jgi:hypothetical protein